MTTETTKTYEIHDLHDGKVYTADQYDVAGVLSELFDVWEDGVSEAISNIEDCIFGRLNGASEWGSDFLGVRIERI